MTDRERAIDLIKTVRAEVDPDIGGLSENDCPIVAAMLDEVLALLREQEPVRPEIDSYPFSGFIRFRCGNCGLDLGHGGHKYCWWCGRAVKWDD